MQAKWTLPNKPLHRTGARVARSGPVSGGVGQKLMNNRDQIKDLAMTVNSGLTVYIAIHNAIFRDGATFKSFVKNLFGQGVPMSKLLQDSEGLLPLWDAIHQKIEAFRQSAYLSLSKDERCYFDILSRYVVALRKTVAALVDRQRLMNEGTQGGPNNSMSWEAYQQKEKIYQTAVEEYMAIGQELNAAAPIVFG